MEDITFNLERGRRQLRRPPCLPRRKTAETSRAHLLRLVVWRNGCVENVPPMTVPGVKLIGRCVILHVPGSRDEKRPSYYYTGLVTMVTVSTISMMHVNRYTEGDFAAYRERERRLMVARELSRTNEALSDARFTPGKGDGDPAKGLAAEGLTQRKCLSDKSLVYGHDQDLWLLEGDGRICEIDSARGLASALPLPREAEVRAEGRRHREVVEEAAPDENGIPDGVGFFSADASDSSLDNSFFEGVCQHGISVGPLPYVTIDRALIAAAYLGRDPRSSFYSLFSNPLRELVDMQYLRMFVRQYLVHLSEGYKGGRVTLYHFVMVRGACPLVDQELLKQVAFSELPTLLNADQHCWGVQHPGPEVRAYAAAFPPPNAGDANIEFTLVTSPDETITQQDSSLTRPPRRKKDSCCECFGLFTLEYRRQEC